jgi:hypothetical protein
MDYSRNPVSGTQSEPVTIHAGEIPAHLCLEIGVEFQLELEIVHLHGTQRIQCKARVEGVDVRRSKIQFLGFGKVVETYTGNGRSNELSTDS